MSLQLLVIDDSELNLRLTEMMLTKMNCHVDTFSDVREALKSVKARDYDLIFMDYLMPDINGIEATRLIRRMDGGVHSLKDYYQNVPVIALTAEDNDAMIREMKDNGINDVLLKPFIMTDVCAMIDKWCNSALSKHAREIQEASRSFGHDQDEGISIYGITPDTLSEMLDLDENGYCETISVFVADVHDKRKRINDALASEDYETYTVDVHRIKGEAKVIGAYDIADKAKRLEIVGKALTGRLDNGQSVEDNLVIITNETPALLKDVDKLASSINAFLNKRNLEKNYAAGADRGTVVSDLCDSNHVAFLKTDIEKLKRYVGHALEALESKDTALTKEWLIEIKDFFK